MPKQRRRKCSEPRCCWHRGSKGRTSEGEGLGGERPVPQNKRCLEDAVPEKPKKIGSRDPAEAKALRSSFLCLEVITPTGADGFLRPAQTYVPTTEGRKNNAPPCRTAVHSPKKYFRGLLDASPYLQSAFGRRFLPTAVGCFAWHDNPPLP